MTNEEYVKSLSTEKLTELLINSCHCCIYRLDTHECRKTTCTEGIMEWLKLEHKKPVKKSMPTVKEGDCILYKRGNKLFQAICVFKKQFYCIENSCYYHYNDVIDTIVAIKRYNENTGEHEEIWRVDNE